MTHEETIRSRSLIWRDIINPTEETLEELQKKYGFHDLDLEDCLSKTESPKIEEYKKYVFIVFRFPRKRVRNQQIVIESLNVFIGNGYLITLSNGKLKKMEDFFNHLKEHTREKTKVFKKGSGYLLYQIINDLFEVYIPYVSQLNRSIREIEEDIFEGKVLKDRLYDIMTVKRQIISLKRAIHPHASIIIALEHLHKRFINKELEIYFDDIADKIARGETNLNSMDQMIETLHNAHESLTAHNTNKVMKVLTIFSVVMLPLTFLTGVYGMNVALPLARRADAFLLIMGLMVGLLVLFVLVFKWKRYL